MRDGEPTRRDTDDGGNGKGEDRKDGQRGEWPADPADARTQSSVALTPRRFQPPPAAFAASIPGRRAILYRGQEAHATKRTLRLSSSFAVKAAGPSVGSDLLYSQRWQHGGSRLSRPSKLQRSHPSSMTGRMMRGSRATLHHLQRPMTSVLQRSQIRMHGPHWDQRQHPTGPIGVVRR